MSRRRVRALVVDDSAFARKVIREALLSSGQIEVVGIARDGLEALERVAELKPEVVTLDLMMPGLDGLGFLRALPRTGAPRVIVVSVADLDSPAMAEALACGAVAAVHKPTALATGQLYSLSDRLVQTVLAAAPPAAEPDAEAAGGPAASRRLVLIGTSTGGPQALTRLLSALPAAFPAPIGAVLHIPVGYTAALAARLDQSCAISVAEAEPGMVFRPGLAILARAGMHLRVQRDGDRLVAQLTALPAHRPHCPAVDELFLSGAAAVGANAIGVVLTGMGDDGLEGAGAIAGAGGTLLAEAQSSCIVYGMSRCVLEAGFGALAVPLERMGEEILHHVRS